MPGTASTTQRSLKLDVRLTPSAKATLGAAARVKHQSVSQFVLESALARAEETLSTRQRFDLDAAHWDKFQAALDAPPQSLAPRMQRLLRERSPFDPE